MPKANMEVQDDYCKTYRQRMGDEKKRIAEVRAEEERQIQKIKKETERKIKAIREEEERQKEEKRRILQSNKDELNSVVETHKEENARRRKHNLALQQELEEVLRDINDEPTRIIKNEEFRSKRLPMINSNQIILEVYSDSDIVDSINNEKADEIITEYWGREIEEIDLEPRCLLLSEP